MEEAKNQEEINQEEIKQLTFDPILMQEEIYKLKVQVSMLKAELVAIRKEPLKIFFQDLLLALFGGQYIDEMEVNNEKRKSM